MMPDTCPSSEHPRAAAAGWWERHHGWLGPDRYGIRLPSGAPGQQTTQDTRGSHSHHRLPDPYEKGQSNEARGAGAGHQEIAGMR